MLHDTKANKIFLLVVVAVLGIAFASRPVAKKVKGTQTLSYPFPSGSSLDVNTVSDSVTVKRDPAAKELTVSYKGAGTLKGDETKDGIAISVENPTSFFSFAGSGMLMVTIPQGDVDTLEVTSTSGSLHTMGNLEMDSSLFRTVSGRIDIQDLDSAGTTSISSTSGGVDISTLASMGKVDISSTSGHVDVRDFTGTDLHAHSVSGSIDLQLHMEEGSLKASTTSGSMNIALEQETPSYRIDAHSTSGSLDIMGHNAENSLSLAQGEEKLKANLSSSSGSVNIQGN